MNKKVLWLPILTAFFMSACSVAYIPNKQNVPLMSEKGDASVNIGISNLQGAYAFTDHFAAMTNFYFRQNDVRASSYRGINTSGEYNASRLLAEGAVGFFKSYGENLVVEMYGGGGIGNIRFDYDAPIFSNDRRTYHANMYNYFVQPDIGFKGKYIDIVVSTRFSLVRFYNVNTINYTETNLEYEDLHYLDKQPYLFFEPALTMRIGYEFLKLYSQILLTNKMNIEPINYKQLNVHIGMEIDLDFLLSNSK